MKQYNILLNDGRALLALGYSRANAAMAATKAHGINPGHVVAVMEA